MGSYTRRIQPLIQEDLLTKMVWVAGPRQAGKTTLARDIVKGETSAYFNWDVAKDRLLLLKNRLPEERRVWVFDEIHKYNRWRNWLKGVYDEHHEEHPILVTGSAKLDVFSRGGDSLQGRYFFYRLHPFTLSEYLGIKLGEPEAWLHDVAKLPIANSKAVEEGVAELLELGGFPEPLFSGSARFSNRWKLGYSQRLIREELNELYKFQNLDLIELLFERLPETVGSSLTLKPFARDLETSYESVRSWVIAFEKLYSCFRVPPFGVPKFRTVNKEQKLYMWDWSRVPSPGGRLENLVALHLLRFTHWCEDVVGEKIELRYFRDVVGREVDFILLRKKEPWIAIEVKSSEQPLDPNLQYFLERVRCPYAFQLQLKSKSEYKHAKINGCDVRSVPLGRFLANLP